MTVRLAHLSDIHFGGENAPAVAAATQMLNAGAFDLVVVTGDILTFEQNLAGDASSQDHFMHAI